MQITIALLQMTSCGNDQAANLSKGEEFYRRAHNMGTNTGVSRTRDLVKHVQKAAPLWSVNLA